MVVVTSININKRYCHFHFIPNCCIRWTIIDCIHKFLDYGDKFEMTHTPKSMASLDSIIVKKLSDLSLWKDLNDRGSSAEKNAKIIDRVKNAGLIQWSHAINIANVSFLQARVYFKEFSFTQVN